MDYYKSISDKLTLAEKTFCDYANQHIAKGTFEGYLKAGNNLAAAMLMSEAQQELSTLFETLPDDVIKDLLIV